MPIITFLVSGVEPYEGLRAMPFVVSPFAGQADGGDVKEHHSEQHGTTERVTHEMATSLFA